MQSQETEVCVFSDNHSLIQAAADHVIQKGLQAIKTKERFTIALAGGSTPKNLYALLASPDYRSRLDWRKAEFFWGDERHVPPDHHESNYRMAYETMLSSFAVSEKHIHRIHGELPQAQEAADRYEKVLRSRLGDASSHPPPLNLVLLGMGADGHTASLFPGTDAIQETSRWVSAPWVEKFQTFRITMTPALINRAQHVTFLVSGREKANALREILEGEFQPDLYPAQIIRPATGKLTWLIDEEAAGSLSPHVRTHAT